MSGLPDPADSYLGTQLRRRRNTVGMGMLYATDAGAKVIVAANGSIYHSAFAEAASKATPTKRQRGPDLLRRRPQHRQPQLPPANYGHAAS